MAAALVSEEQLTCSICLEVFTDPVSTPCGHNFCKHCITKHWDHSELCQCPMCKQEFSCRPGLQVNTLVSEMVLQLRNRSQQDCESPELQASTAEVLCDVCTEPKRKALRSCLVCLLSYCQIHLQPHETVSRLKRHQLTEPVENMEERMCPKHDKLLELFCRTDNTCLCTTCPLVEHKNHECVFLKDEYDLRRSSLQQTQTEVQLMVEQRKVKIQEMKSSLELSQESVDRERATGLQIFTSLIQCVQKRQEEFIEELQEKHRQTKQQTEDWITELEQEICELEKRCTDIQQLRASEDHLHVLQRVSSLKTPTDMKDWTQVTLETPSYEGSLDRAVVQLQTTLKEELNKINKVQLKRLQQWAVDVTLDPDTAHPQLVLSEDLKQVYNDGVEKTLPDKPQRITAFGGVLGKQSFSSGRFYFEVQVKEKTRWDLGVVKESINRNKNDNLSPKNGFWTVIMRDGDDYRGCGSPAVSLSLASAPERVGVFVDYEQGLVSFYDVDTAALIYLFTDCTFTEKIYPYCSPCVNCEGKNSTPLIIIPVKENE